MNDILITLYCPPTSKTYDFWAAKNMTAKDALIKFSDAICEYEGKPDVFSDKETLILCSYMTKKALVPDETLESAGIKSGDKLALL